MVLEQPGKLRQTFESKGKRVTLAAGPLIDKFGAQGSLDGNSFSAAILGLAEYNNCYPKQ